MLVAAQGPILAACKGATVAAQLDALDVEMAVEAEEVEMSPEQEQRVRDRILSVLTEFQGQRGITISMMAGQVRPYHVAWRVVLAKMVKEKIVERNDLFRETKTGYRTVETYKLASDATA